jgi:hypothetical protein
MKKNKLNRQTHMIARHSAAISLLQSKFLSFMERYHKAECRATARLERKVARLTAKLASKTRKGSKK